MSLLDISEADCREFFLRDNEFRIFVEIFNTLRRKYKDFFRDIDFYKGFNKTDSVLLWLCDESSHHVVKFVTQVDSYIKIFVELRSGNTVDTSVLIQPSVDPKRDHILADMFDGTSDVDATHAKFITWAEATRNGVLKKLDKLLQVVDSQEIRRVTSMENIKELKSFLCNHRESLVSVSFDGNVNVRLHRRFMLYQDTN